MATYIGLRKNLGVMDSTDYPVVDIRDSGEVWIWTDRITCLEMSRSYLTGLCNDMDEADEMDEEVE